MTGTYKHRLLILRNNKLEWEYLINIKITDYLCINTQSVHKQTNLTVSNYEIDTRLAYIIGCILRRGYKTNGVIKLLLSHTVAKQFCDYFSSIFYELSYTEQKHKCSITIDLASTISLLDRLVGNKNQLPWAICKTGYAAQLSFAAALVDTSSIHKIAFDSPTLGKELLILLNSLGIMCDLKFNNVAFPQGEAFVLYDKINQYCAEEHIVTYTERTWYGVPVDGKIVSYDDYEGDDEIAKSKYRFVKVTSIKDAGIQPVFDLTINPYNPSYIANGIVSHNTAETSLSVFIESLRAYRDSITRKLLYNKIFPLISVVNGLSIKNGKIIKSGKPHEIEDALDKLQDGSRLLIPVVHWSKQLKPEGDTAYLDLLDRMTAAGVPVPLRAMAAAGGFNLDELLSQQSDDISMRTRIKEYVDKLARFKAQEGGGDDGGGEMEASALPLLDESPDGKYYSSVLAKGGKRSILNRGFDSEIIGTTKTGKKKFIADQISANKNANQAIIKAVRTLAKRDNTTLTRPSVTKPTEK